MTIQRRHFLGAMGALCAGTVLAEGKLVKEKEEREFPPLFKVKPYVQLTGGDSLAVRWQTALPASAEVFWSQDPGLPRAKWHRAFSARDGMVCVNETNHTVVLSGFDPAKAIVLEAVSRVALKFHPYDIKMGPATGSGVLSLRALLPGGRVCFAVLNDLHNRNQLIPLMLKQVEKANPAFVAFNGDCWADPTSEEAALNFLPNPLGLLAEQGAPALFVRGNHEYRGAMARRVRNYLSPLAGGNYYGALTLGNLRLILLDCGEDKPDSEPVYGGFLDCDAYLKEQAAWFEKEIASEAYRAAKWHVVMVHIPPTSLSERGDAWYGPTRLRGCFDALLAKSGIDAMLCAHTHRYQLVKPEESGRAYPILIGGGPSEERAAVMLVKADERAFSVEVLNAEGKKLFSI